MSLKSVLVLVCTGLPEERVRGFISLRPIFHEGSRLELTHLPPLWSPIIRQVILPSKISGNCHYFILDRPDATVVIDGRPLKSFRAPDLAQLKPSSPQEHAFVVPLPSVTDFLIEFYSSFFPLEAMLYAAKLGIDLRNDK